MFRFACDISSGILRDMLEDALCTEFLDGALRVDTTIEHTHEIVCPWEDELDVVRYEDLHHRT